MMAVGNLLLLDVKMENKFKVGDRVVAYIRYDSSYDDYIMCQFRHDYEDEEHGIGHGTITEVSDKRVTVNWDEDEENDIVENLLDFCKPELLLLESELPDKISKLEQEYQAIQESLKDKVKLAAKTIAEADAIARSVGMSLSETEFSYDLYRAMSGAGWQMSSIGC